MRIFICLVLQFALTAFSFNAIAQNSTVKGKIMVQVTKEDGETIQDVTISVLKVKDSSLVKASLTGKGGNAELENIKQGTYLLSATFIGYKKIYSKPFTVNPEHILIEEKLILQPAPASTLKEVSVSAKKPFIERQFDKLVVNVENSIVSAGSSVMEILERSPGISIDQNDNISMKGKSGVLIMIDGKITPISGADLANMLKGLPSNAIEKIELITNPSAKYDASGTAGIINIKMKKDQKLGTNGSLTAGAGYGKYGRHNEGISFNHRNRKLNVFGNYNFSQRKQCVELTLQRRFFNEFTDTLTGGFDQKTIAQQPITNHTGRVGMDFFPSKRAILGFVISGIYNNQGRHYISYAKALNYKETVDSTFTTFNNSQEILKTYAINLNYKHSFDSIGRDLFVDFDYANFRSNMDPRLDVIYYDLSGQQKGNLYTLLGISNGNLNIYSVKTDYINPLKKNARLETGVKSSYVKADNDLVFHQVINNISAYDSSRSNHFIYEENINAAYLNISKAGKKVNMQAGLRIEQTNIKGNQVTIKESLDSSYLKIFPSATVNFDLKNKNIVGLSVSRRIGRPNYNQLNPFKYFIDPTSYRTGNTSLQPQFTYAYEFSYTHKQTIVTLSYSKTKNNILAVLMPVEDGGKIYSVETSANLAVVHNFGVSILSSFKIAKWWNTQNSIDAFFNKFIGNVANTPLDDGSPGLLVNNNNSFSFNKSWTGEAIVSFRAKQQIGYATYGSVFRFAAGAQKIIMHKKGTLRFNLSDVFHTDIANNTSSFSIYHQDYRVVRNTRIATVIFTYRFGKNTIARARTRNGGAEEEKNRAN